MGPAHTYPDIFKNGDIFFLRFSFASTPKQRFRAPKTQVFENGPQKGVCLKTLAYRFRVRGRKRRFLNTMMSYIIQRKPCKRCYRIFTVLAFSCGRAKTIRIRYVRTRTFFRKRRKKSSFSKKFRIRVEETSESRMR